MLVSGQYYNVLEPEVAEVIQRINGLGHEIGLHFDMDVAPGGASAKEAQLRERIFLEKQIVEAITGEPIRTMSFHNYVLHESRLDCVEQICGMLNASTERFQKGYKFVSDSNGIWRYDRLEDVLMEILFPRLHVVTHPVWWTPELMAPVMRLRRVVDGRARRFRFLFRRHETGWSIWSIGAAARYRITEMRRWLNWDGFRERLSKSVRGGGSCMLDEDGPKPLVAASPLFL